MSPLPRPWVSTPLGTHLRRGRLLSLSAGANPAPSALGALDNKPFAFRALVASCVSKTLPSRASFPCTGNTRRLTSADAPAPSHHLDRRSPSPLSLRDDQTLSELVD